MFTSCCPGWVRFVKTQFPYMVNYLSTAKSPQQMFGAVMKTYFAEKLGVSPDQIFTLSIMPCVAKKGEREMDLFYGEYAGHDVDAVLTTRELVKMIRSAHIRPDTLVEIPSDSPMHGGTGAGVIFGATGGVMEAALRTAYFTLKGENPPADAFKAVRSGGFQENAGVQEAEFTIGDIKLRTAAVSGLGNTRRLLQQIERGEVQYDFVEVMACRAAVSAEADSRFTMVRSWRLREAESSMRWTQKQNCAIPMKTRISGRSTVISLESRCPIRRICCCIRSIGKIIKVSVK